MPPTRAGRAGSCPGPLLLGNAHPSPAKPRGSSLSHFPVTPSQLCALLHVSLTHGAVKHHDPHCLGGSAKPRGREAGSRLPTATLGAELLAELPPQNSPATLPRSAIRLPGTGLSPLPSPERGRRLPVPVPTPGSRRRRLPAPQPPRCGRPHRGHRALQPPQNRAGAVPTCPRATHGTRRTAVQPVQPVLHLLLRRDGSTAAPPATSP